MSKIRYMLTKQPNTPPLACRALCRPCDQEMLNSAKAGDIDALATALIAGANATLGVSFMCVALTLHHLLAG